MNHRLSLGAAFTALLLTAFFVTGGGAQPNSVKKIADGVWFRRRRYEKPGALETTSIIEMKDYLIVVDANFPSGARWPWPMPKRLSPKPVKYVFNHAPPRRSRLRGSRCLDCGSAPPPSRTKAVVDEMNRYEPARWQAARQEPSRRRRLEAAMHPRSRSRRSREIASTILKKIPRAKCSSFSSAGRTHAATASPGCRKSCVLCTGDAFHQLSRITTPRTANLGNWPQCPPLQPKS